MGSRKRGNERDGKRQTDQRVEGGITVGTGFNVFFIFKSLRASECCSFPII